MPESPLCSDGHACIPVGTERRNGAGGGACLKLVYIYVVVSVEYCFR